MLRVKRKLTDEEGLTLVELLAAIMILSIIVISFLGFFTQSAQTNNRTNSVNEATFLAQEEIERITYYSASRASAFMVARCLLSKSILIVTLF
ncbi:MAG TPA: type II secretion system protein [Fastidiosipila sp.]|nr:type II secretion system protein [Fastidiosipila sp.]